MAYAALVSLSQTIDRFLLRQDQYPISLHEKQEVISIHEHTIFLQGFLEKFSQKENDLEGRIRDVANRAEDIIEKFVWKQMDQKRDDTSESTSGSESSEVSLLMGMGFGFEKKLKKVTRKIESIVGEVKEIESSARSTDDDSCVASCSSSSSSSRVIIAPPANVKPIVGLENDLLKIKDRLRGGSRQLQIIPIFGMGGIGKSTLARHAYDDQSIVEHFQIRAWVTLSQDYSVRQILSSLIVSVGAEQSAKSDGTESEMTQKVYQSLMGRSYLMVLDDVWSTKAWDDVRRILPKDLKGSRILLTARSSDVAAYPDSSAPLHEMRFMNVEESWNLLQKKVFKQGDCPCELEGIGKKIAESCRGLPLAIVVIAGLLSNMSQTPASWEYIASNVNEVVTTNDEQFAKIMSLSYNHLPYHLRSCFLYMGLFPEDYEIRVSKLLKLWVAEGFLKSPNGSENLEEVAEGYLEDLVKRSLVLVMKRKTNGKIKSCSVHDLVRDLCIRKAQQEKFLLHVHSNIPEESIRNQRRISIKNSGLDFLKVIRGLSSTIHTIISFQRESIPWSRFSLKKLRLLRVFEAANTSTVYDLPDCQAYGLLHLRYLSLSIMTRIPTTISNLENLQTLIINPRTALRLYGPGEVRFPREIWRVLQLRHLDSSTYYCLPDPPEEEPKFALEKLQTLSVANFVCSESTMERIPNLKKLVVGYSRGQRRYAHDYDDYHLENLVHLHHLEKLKLLVRLTFPFPEKLNPVFPRTLKKLTLIGWQLSSKDIGTVVGSLPSLEVLKLKKIFCEHDNKWVTQEGEFCSLKFLLVEEQNLCLWITESSHFPRLERLLLHYCWNLDEIPDAFGEISTLELVEIDGGKESLFNSAKRIQEEHETLTGVALQLRLMR